MSSEAIAAPEEGELVVATIKTVKQNGAYVDLDEYEGIEGFIFIGEIASGWVKNIRGFVREGQRVICKVLRTRRDGTSLELSLKSVSEERRRDRLQEWKNEQRAHQLFKVLGEKIGWSDEELEAQSEELVDVFGTLYAAFEEAAMQKEPSATLDLKVNGFQNSLKSPSRTSFLPSLKYVASSPSASTSPMAFQSFEQHLRPQNL